MNEADWNIYGAGVIPYQEDLVIPEGYLACHSHHVLHKIPRNLYIVCFECGHPWTKHTLRKAYRKALWRLRKDPWTDNHSIVSSLKDLWLGWTTPAKHIHFCQECIHDF